ncbi:MAG: AbrB family transcriptional regulator [Anaerolinea sp.]|nr:AbrB family transcriptional regulator [Anaerolinea sp.]
MKAIVSEKGQVTIPKKLRDELGIKPGQVLDFVREDGRLVIEKAPADDPIARIWGILGEGRSTDEYMAFIRPSVEE